MPRVSPRDRTVNLSPTAKACETLCDINTTATPFSRTFSTVFNTLEVWYTPKADVGSSSINISAPKNTARAMATVCLSPPERVPID